MLFVDGENFVIQAQNYAKEFGFTLTEGDFYECKCLSGFQVILQHKNKLTLGRRLYMSNAMQSVLSTILV
jgi:hypothetical protein